MTNFQVCFKFTNFPLLLGILVYEMKKNQNSLRLRAKENSFLFLRSARILDFTKEYIRKLTGEFLCMKIKKTFLQTVIASYILSNFSYPYTGVVSQHYAVCIIFCRYAAANDCLLLHTSFRYSTPVTNKKALF